MRFRCRPIDLIRKHHVRKYGPSLKFKEFLPCRVLSDHIGTDNVTRHQVRRKLDPRKLQMHYVCQRLHKFGLADSRYAFEQHMPLDKQARHNTGDDFLIANDDARHFLAYAFEMIPELFDSSFYVATHSSLLS